MRGIDRFWQNCGESLAEWLEETGNKGAASEIDDKLSSPEWKNPSAAHEAFLACVAKVGKRPVLLVDNFDLILDALPSDQHWQLRRALQSRDGPVLYGASSQFLRQSGDKAGAFYEFFQIHELEPLTEVELLDCVRRLVDARGIVGNPVREILEREPQRLRALHTLTGGNPRVLVLIYQLLERAESMSVVTDLEILLDQMTPFYKSRIEELKTELPRSIVDAKVSPKSARLVHLLGHAFEDLGQYKSAENAYRRSVELEPTKADPWVCLAKLLDRRFGRTKEAEDAFHRALDLNPLSEFVLDEFGDFLRRLERFEEAEQIYRRAVDLSPASESAWSSLGWLLHDVGRYEEAEALFRNLIEKHPDNADGWVALGELCGNHFDRPEEAEAAFRRALELDPKSAYAWSSLGRVLFLQNRMKDAETAFRTAVEHAPNYSRGWVGLAQLLREDPDRADETEAAIRRAIEHEPTGYRQWVMLATHLEECFGRYDESAAAFRRALEINPNSSITWGLLGDLLQNHLNRFDEASVAYLIGSGKQRTTLSKPPFMQRLWLILGARLPCWM